MLTRVKTKLASKDDVSITSGGLQPRSPRMRACGGVQSRLTCGDHWVDRWKSYSENKYNNKVDLIFNQNPTIKRKRSTGDPYLGSSSSEVQADL